MKAKRWLHGLAMTAWCGVGLAEQPALTIYNQDFAVVREVVPLELEQGVNEVRFTDITAHLEPDSVMLRDRAGKRNLQILEQNYRADPVSQDLLLSLYEGKTIDFLLPGEAMTNLVAGKIVRSGYTSHASGLRRYGQHYYQTQMAHAYGGGAQSIIEVEGRLRFGLPGIPLFPALADDTILEPTLHWLLETDEAGPLDAELAYITGGMSWEAAYNLVSPEKGDLLDLVGWVTMDNQSGRTFEQARIKLMAGDVSKIQRDDGGGDRFSRRSGLMAAAEMEPPVSEKTFDEYHLYTLNRPTTLHDRETKQVEFVRASGVQSQRIYVYDGAQIDENRYRGWSVDNIRQDRDYGTQSNSKVWVMREFKNSEENNLGLPLPRGMVRFYRRDDDGRLEFIGENTIDHTPKDEVVRVYTGNAFDITGERRRTDYSVDGSEEWLKESFEIKLRNHKKEAVEVRVVEHLYRWVNWTIPGASGSYKKLDAQTVEFPVTLEPDAEATVTYTAHYTW